MQTLFERRWWLLPACSGLLLMLVFRPADLWLVGFVALAPLYYAVAAFPARRLRIAFWSGAVTGGLYSGYLSFFTLEQFHWLPEAYLFAWGVRFAALPVAAISAAVVGLSIVCYRLLRTRFFVLNAVVGAATYTLADVLLRMVFGGFYFGMLGDAATHVPVFMVFSTLGGETLVSFLVAFPAVLVVEALLAHRVRAYITAGAIIAVLLGGGVLLRHYLYAPSPVVQTFSVVSIQVGAREKAAFGTSVHNTFSFPDLAGRLQEAASGTPNLIVYPFSPVEGAIYRGPKDDLDRSVLAVPEAEFGAWLRGQVPGPTVVMTWNALYTDHKFYNLYQYWSDGLPIGSYSKRALFPLFDYTPPWAQSIGFFTTPFDDQPAGPQNPVRVAGVPLGSLLCSEIGHAELARTDAQSSLFIIAAGSEAMFAGDIAGYFDLHAAQFRAAENDIPLLRANLLGPSAFIASDGRIQQELPHGVSGLLRATVTLHVVRQTFFNRFGNTPFLASLVVVLAAAALVRRRWPPAF